MRPPLKDVGAVGSCHGDVLPTSGVILMKLGWGSDASGQILAPKVRNNKTNVNQFHLRKKKLAHFVNDDINYSR